MRNLVQILIAVVIVGGILALASLGSGQQTLVPRPEPAATSVATPTPAAANVDTGHVASEAGHPAETPSTAPAVAQAESPSPTPDVPAETVANAATVDLSAGRQVYRRCQACHSLEPDRNGVGPTLAGVIGRRAGAVPGYNYSGALLDSGVVWDAASLDAYVRDPQGFIPGNKMPFPGLKTDNQRRELIAFLEVAAAGTPPDELPVANAPPEQIAAGPSDSRPTVKYIPDVRFTLRTGTMQGSTAFIGDGGAIDGQVNPTLTAAQGQVVQLTLINGEEGEHDIVFADQRTRSPRIIDRGASTTIAFRADAAGEFRYASSVPGRPESMSGAFVVTAGPPVDAVVEADISRLPDDLPPPITRRQPETVRLDLVTVEHEARLADGTTYMYWTFNGRVPGPFVRVRVGDTIDVHVKNAADSTLIHSVDFHAATGPGGGAAALQVDPGDEKSMKWKALMPGLYVYHCATPMVAHHIASGMYGLILVEPEEGLPAVDREFYVMQGEIYTEATFGQRGSQEFSVDKLLGEDPEYFVFNGSVGAISSLHPMHAEVGETVRIFFGVGGPNFTSSFHVIGEIFDKVYSLASIVSEPLEGVQTVTVPAGGATIVDFKLDVPGNYILVDHALARAERGLVGILTVKGEPNPEIFDGVVAPGSGH